MPAIGFGLGLERLLLVLESEGIEIPKPVYNDLYIGSIGENAHLNAFKYVNLLRERGLKCECDHMAKSVKAQMKYANKIDSRFTIILGDDELASCKAKMKRMSDGEQFEIDLNNLDEIANMVLNS